jgi:hypothetical protein
MESRIQIVIKMLPIRLGLRMLPINFILIDRVFLVPTCSREFHSKRRDKTRISKAVSSPQQLSPLVSLLRRCHRVGRVLSFFSSRRNWNSPLTRRRVCPPPLWYWGGGGAHSLAGVPISTRGHTLWLWYYVLCG